MNKNILELGEIDHKDHLIQTNEHIDNLKIEVETSNINDESHNVLYEKIIRILDRVGHLSSICFKHTDELETYFYETYKDSAEALTNWLDYTHSIHKKYDKQKNKCFKLIDVLDQRYYSKFKKEPQNWIVNEMPLLDYINYQKSN